MKEFKVGEKVLIKGIIREVDVNMCMVDCEGAEHWYDYKNICKVKPKAVQYLFFDHHDNLWGTTGEKYTTDEEFMKDYGVIKYKRLT